MTDSLVKRLVATASVEADKKVEKLLREAALIIEDQNEKIADQEREVKDLTMRLSTVIAATQPIDYAARALLQAVNAVLPHEDQVQRDVMPWWNAQAANWINPKTGKALRKRK